MKLHSAAFQRVCTASHNYIYIYAASTRSECYKA